VIEHHCQAYQSTGGPSVSKPLPRIVSNRLNEKPSSTGRISCSSSTIYLSLKLYYCLLYTNLLSPYPSGEERFSRKSLHRKRNNITVNIHIGYQPVSASAKPWGLSPDVGYLVASVCCQIDAASAKNLKSCTCGTSFEAERSTETSCTLFGTR